MSIELLNQAYPGWHYRPPAHMSKPFIRVGAIDFDSVTPLPAIDTPQTLCGVKAGLGEYIVVHHMEVQASIFTGGLFERLSPEAAHRMLYWTFKSTQVAEEPLIATGSILEEDQQPGIGLFGAFSVEAGTMAPIIVSPGATAHLSLVHVLAGGGLMTIPAGSKLSAVMSGYRVAYKPGSPPPQHEAPTHRPAAPPPRPRSRPLAAPVKRPAPRRP